MDKKKYNFVELKFAQPFKELKEAEPQDILQVNSMFLLIGKQNVGKTSTFSKALLEPHLLGGKYIHWLLVGPSEFPDLDIHNKRVHLCKEFDVSWMIDTLKQINKDVKTKGHSERKHVLIVLDDVLTELEENARNVMFNKLLNQRRHYEGLDCLIIDFAMFAQSFPSVPKKWRRCMNYAIAWGISDEDFNKLQGECSYRLALNKRMIAQEHMRKNIHNFVVLKINTNELFLNFEEAV